MKLAMVGALIIAGPFVFWSSGGSWRQASTRKRGGSPFHHRGHRALFRGGAVFAYASCGEPAAYLFDQDAHQLRG